MDAWPDEPITRRDALLAAQRRLRALGHEDAQLPGGGDADVVAGDLVAVLDSAAARTDVAAVRALAGRAAVEGKVGCLFSIPGFTDEAVTWADHGGVVLFVYDRLGGTEPVGRMASDAVARGTLTTAPFGSGDLADPVEVAAAITDGLVGGPVGEIGLWDGGAGQALTLRPEPGDRQIPSAVLVSLYPPAPPPPGALDESWEQSERRFPGGGFERVWTRRCVHANHPPTTVAGEAVATAIGALGVCGIDFERCRVEVRSAPAGGGAPSGDGRALDGVVLGPVGRRRRVAPAPGEAASGARIVARLVSLARADGAARAAAVEGVSPDGEFAWRLEARRSGGRFGTARWHIESRVPSSLVKPERPAGLLRPAGLTVGASRWSLVGRHWRSTAAGADLESLAHAVIADLAGFYSLAGASLETTALRDPA